MRTIDTGEAPVVAYYASTLDDLAAVESAVRGASLVAVDTETYGLAPFTDGGVRLLQVGVRGETGYLSWVLPVDVDDAVWRDQVAGFARRLTDRRCLVGHNIAFDALAIQASLGVDILDAVVADTMHLAHAIDPRPREEGGVGLGLKDLARMVSYPGLQPQALGRAEEALKAEARRRRWRLGEMWGKWAIDDPLYLAYAATDTAATLAVHEVAWARLRAVYGEVPHFLERDLQTMRVFTRALYTGLRVDQEYAAGLADELTRRETEAAAEAALLGVGNVSSPQQVAAGLEAAGARLTEWTATGAPKVDKAVLKSLEGEVPLAGAVLRAKRAAKTRETYVRPIGSNPVVRPLVSVLKARTGRMAVSSPPLQQLPSGDWEVRRMVVARPGHVLVSADYSQLELRLLAALANVEGMRRSIAEGRDMLDDMAAAVFGPSWTPAQRKLAKTVAYGKVYGGGAAGLARQSGAPVEDIKRTLDGFDRSFPEVKRFAARLEREARLERYPHVRTLWGRRLPVDQQRLYAATNYVVQGSARDVFGHAANALEDAGLAEFVRLPIHDEILFEVPEDPATLEEVLPAIGAAMSVEVRGVPLAAEAEVYGYSWGAGYGAPDAWRERNVP